MRAIVKVGIVCNSKMIRKIRQALKNHQFKENESRPLPVQGMMVLAGTMPSAGLEPVKSLQGVRRVDTSY